MRLLPSNLCFSATPQYIDSTAVPTALSYSIDNIYIGAVIKNFGKIPRPVGGEVGYRTYHYVK